MALFSFFPFFFSFNRQCIIEYQFCGCFDLTYCKETTKTLFTTIALCFLLKHKVSLDNVVSSSKDLNRVIVLFKTVFLPGTDAFQKWVEWSIETIIADMQTQQKSEVSDQHVTEACVCVLLLCICCGRSRSDCGLYNKGFPVETEVLMPRTWKDITG